MPKAAIVTIVDDDELIRESMQAFIESLGYTSEAFASAEEYIASDRARATSCLVVDVQLPGMSGFDLQDWLISNQYRTPIIFISGFYAEPLKGRMKETVAVGFLTKPVNVGLLEEYLKEALRRWGQHE
jgi:FixJ family two-component response regulator